ncbi:hypothetical protein BHE74_00028684 [Ensete ventricosum]|nr:hypothetical protein BHE74_00028684 [Ensete ventricosum]RZS06164.1 hypothetical protein BHM03_00036780 [Ensete ventricosum]
MLQNRRGYGGAVLQVAAMLLEDGSQGNMDPEAAVTMEEEEDSSNTGCGWLQQRCGCDRGKKRKGGHGCCKGGQQQWAPGVGNLRSEGSLLAASKSDGSDISLLATCAARNRCWLQPNCCWPQEIAAGCERSLLAALCSERSLLVTLCSEGSLLATSKADGSGRSLLAAAKVDGSERSLLVVIKSLLATIKVDGCERSLLAAFVQQEIAASCDQGRWQREIAAGSVVQREIAVGHDQIAAGRNQGRWL